MHIRRFGREIGNIDDQVKSDKLPVEGISEGPVEDFGPFVDTSLRKVRVQRGPGGFGFSVTPTQPPVVCVVFGDSPASRRGLKVGDRIVAINGRESGESHISDIIRLILNQKTPLELLVSRPLMYSTDIRKTLITHKMISKIKKAFRNLRKKREDPPGEFDHRRNHLVEEWLSKRIAHSRPSLHDISFDTTCDRAILPPYLTPLDPNQSTSSLDLLLPKPGDFAGRLLALKLFDVEMHVLSRLGELGETSGSAFKFAAVDHELCTTVVNLIHEISTLTRDRLDSIKDLLNHSNLSAAQVVNIYEMQILSIRFAYSSYHSALALIPAHHSLLAVPVDALREIGDQFERHRSLVSDTRGLDFVLKVFRASINLCQSAASRE